MENIDNLVKLAANYENEQIKKSINSVEDRMDVIFPYIGMIKQMLDKGLINTNDIKILFLSVDKEKLFLVIQKVKALNEGLNGTIKLDQKEDYSMNDEEKLKSLNLVIKAIETSELTDKKDLDMLDEYKKFVYADFKDTDDNILNNQLEDNAKRR